MRKISPIRVKWIQQPMCVSTLHPRRLSNVRKTPLTNFTLLATLIGKKPTKSGSYLFLSCLECSSRFFCVCVLLLCLECFALTFSYSVWSVHLASRDRDGVLGQCVRQRPVVPLALHRNKISLANKK